MTTKNHDIICTHRWMSICQGFEGEPYILSSPGTYIVPLNEAGEVLFVLEPRRVDAQVVLSLPGGAVDENEEWVVSANRELQEEIGYKAGRLDYLGSLNPAVRVADWQIHIFLGRDLTPSKLKGDESYEMPIERIPLSQLEALIASKRLTDAMIIASLYMARGLIDAGK